MSDNTELEKDVTWAGTVNTDTVGISTVKVTVDGKEYDVELEVAEKEPTKSNATATATTVNGDNYYINPLGSVSINLTYGDNIKSSDIQELTISIYNGEKLLATNVLQPKKLNDVEKGLGVITSPFNIGRDEIHDKWAWQRGVYKLQGTEVTEADLPNKVIAKYVVDGTTYESEIELTETLRVPKSYEGLAAPADGLKELIVSEVNKDGALFIVYGLDVEGTTRQKPSTLEEVKTFIDKKYGVNFNANAIKIADGKISIDGSILSPSDWHKVKANGDKGVPYKITLVKDGISAEESKVPADAKVAKIAMYEDGVAVIEKM